MKMKSGVEQAICILAMLATQLNQRPLKSFILSKRLQVSDSYLKKIVRHLVVAGLVISSASKEGGFSLAKSPSEMTMLDIFEAIEGKKSAIQSSHLAERVFFSNDHVIQKENEVLNIFGEAERLFKRRLSQFSLNDVLTSHDYEKKQFDWVSLTDQSVQGKAGDSSNDQK
ncbi:Rrf2 family transcriptional regulator [Sporolactobacillus sp. CPB3-1]|uniref:Rrf2 family transcriptional regulator n=1 Tax=Sporolactobacillus mangiferae TaxID=2940498 RepID=A0ABT0M8H8_9BACL|nr:Rrf2 family transcriptional regulator [Sporolactobacillus mangiferae]MCL1631179.1 Rrf2 family transcriptional regulator [Sporolactobacillus mangiferae]